jgi:hypothetical protein
LQATQTNLAGIDFFLGRAASKELWIEGRDEFITKTDSSKVLEQLLSENNHQHISQTQKSKLSIELLAISFGNLIQF